MNNEELEIQKNIENCVKANNEFSISSKEVEHLNKVIYDVSKSSLIAIDDIGITISNLFNNINLSFGDVIERLKLNQELNFSRESWNSKEKFMVNVKNTSDFSHEMN